MSVERVVEVSCRHYIEPVVLVPCCFECDSMLIVIMSAVMHTSYYISTFGWSKRSIATVVAHGVSRARRKSVSLPLY